MIGLVPKDYINFWPCGHKCEHEGCLASGSVVCRVPDNPELAASGKPIYDSMGIEVIENLCPDHAYEAGYCACCGDFWGGIESFDFDNPSMLCENCRDACDLENGEMDENWGEI